MVCLAVLVLYPIDGFTQRLGEETLSEYRTRMIEDLVGVKRWINQQYQQFAKEPEYLECLRESEEIIGELNSTPYENEEKIEKLEERKTQLKQKFMKILKSGRQEIEMAVRVDENKSYLSSQENLKHKRIFSLKKFTLISGLDAKIKHLENRAMHPGELRDDLQFGWIFRRSIKFSEQLATKTIINSCLAVVESARKEFLDKKQELIDDISKLKDLDKIINAYEEFELWQKNRVQYYENRIRFVAISRFAISELKSENELYLRETKSSIKKYFVRRSPDVEDSIARAIKLFEDQFAELIANFESSCSKNYQQDVEGLKTEIAETKRLLDNNRQTFNQMLSECLAKSLNLDLEINPHIMKFYEELNDIKQKKLTKKIDNQIGKKIYREYFIQFDSILETAKKDISIKLPNLKYEYYKSSSKSSVTRPLTKILAEHVANEAKTISSKIRQISERYEVVYQALERVRDLKRQLKKNKNFQFAESKVSQLEKSVLIMASQIWNPAYTSYCAQAENIKSFCDVLTEISNESPFSNPELHLIKLENKVDGLLLKLSELERHLQAGPLEKYFEFKDIKNDLLKLQKSIRNARFNPHLLDPMDAILETHLTLNSYEQDFDIRRFKIKTANSVMEVSSLVKDDFILALSSVTKLHNKLVNNQESSLDFFVENIATSVNARFEEKVSNLLMDLNNDVRPFEIHDEFNKIIAEVLGEKETTEFLYEIQTRYHSLLANTYSFELAHLSNKDCDAILVGIVESLEAISEYFSADAKKFFYPYFKAAYEFLLVLDQEKRGSKTNVDSYLLNKQRLHKLLGELFSAQQIEFFKLSLEGKKPRTNIGLPNFGYTCYLNAIIKMIIHSDLRYYLSDKHQLSLITNDFDDEEKEEIERFEMRNNFKGNFNLLADRLLGRRYALESDLEQEVRTLIEQFAEILNRDFNYLNQFHDIGEILAKLLEVLQVDPKSHGLNMIEVKKQKAEVTSKNADYFNIWPIDLVSENLENSIFRSFSKRSKDLSHDIDTFIVKAPHTLLIHQKRFKQSTDNSNIFGYEKDQKDSVVTNSLKLPVYGEDTNFSHYAPFKVKGMVIHKGKDVDNGHYVYVDIASKQEVYVHDDETVKFAGRYDQVSKYNRELITKNALILIYEQVQ